MSWSCEWLTEFNLKKKENEISVNSLWICSAIEKQHIGIQRLESWLLRTESKTLLFRGFPSMLCPSFIKLSVKSFLFLLELLFWHSRLSLETLYRIFGNLSSSSLSFDLMTLEVVLQCHLIVHLSSPRSTCLQQKLLLQAIIFNFSFSDGRYYILPNRFMSTAVITQYKRSKDFVVTIEWRLGARTTTEQIETLEEKLRRWIAEDYTVCFWLTLIFPGTLGWPSVLDYRLSA